MEHLQHGMQRKWERHYRETKTNLSIFLILLGLSSFIYLFLIYPQIFSSIIFNSRLKNYVITDIEDYWTCSEHYNNFIIDSPSKEVRLFSFYIFNISNTFTTIQRGFKPSMVETGPYAYEILTTKYNVFFHPIDSSTVSYQEYSILTPVVDKYACNRMYYRMDKNDLLDTDPCQSIDCTCKDPQSIVTIVNPLFIKFITQESSNMLLARYSGDIFYYLRNFYTTDFVEATKAHLVPAALEEIYLFRGFMQTFTLIKTAFDYVEVTSSKELRAKNFLALFRDYAGISYCGLDVYGATGCPWNAAEAMRVVRYDTPSTSKYYRNVTDANIPYNSSSTILDESSPLSFLNQSKGYLNWIAVGLKFGIIDFPFSKGSAMITTQELYEIYDYMELEIAKVTFGDNPTNAQLFGTELLLYVISYHLQTYWISNYFNQVTKLVYKEWQTTSDPVVCSILGYECVWQWGAIADQSSFQMSDYVTYSIIDRATKVNTNPASIYYDGNSASIYNTYEYCQQVLLPNETPQCSDIDYAKNDALVTYPSGLASVIDQVNQINTTLITLNYAKKTNEQRKPYIYLGCNISYLIHSIYRNSTTFHDEYVIRYLNKYKYPTYTHNFTINNWDELGYSQWAGGYVTYALESVFSTYNLKRNGMWYIGQYNYYRTIPEYYSWAIKNGHPYLGISNITKAKILLDSLARQDEVGVELRNHIMYRATTLIGDNTFQYTDTWYTGEFTYLPEYKRAQFNCTGELSEVCNILSYEDKSSSSECQYISNSIYSVCATRIKKRSNWVTNCDEFQTTLTDPINGLACDDTSLFGETHPVLSKRGLIVEKMIFSLTIDIVLKSNIWCPQYDNCQFTQSGLFTTVNVENLLFRGFSDASLVKYLDLKYSLQNISLECVEDSYDSCGNKNFYCSKKGVIIKLQDEHLLLNYDITPHEKYFVDKFYIYNYSKFLWPYDLNETIANNSISIINTESDKIITMINPYYTLYPAWNNKSSLEFIKHYQCQGRFLFGPPSLFSSCVTTINTGKKELSQISNILKYLGNDTIYHYSSGMPVNGTINEQLQPGLWDAFKMYKYNYRGSKKGISFDFYSNPVFWNRIHGLRLEFTQSEIEDWDKLQRIYPVFRSSFQLNQSLEYFIVSRRFQEDYHSWEGYQRVGKPKDTYGMKYDIPIAMSSFERLANYPIYIGTPHNYGNELWGGIEFLQVAGLTPVQQEHRSFVDYDPVTGKVLRRAYRQQFNIRVERSSILQILFSSQGRCVSPTKTFSQSSGYGCFTYIPLYWIEDSRVIDPKEFEQLRGHYYERPDRAYTASKIGIGIGVGCIIFGGILYFVESYKRKIFMKRIYID